MAEHIAVLGGGSWGMALADLLYRGGHRVTLWEYDPADCERLARKRTNPDRLRDFYLPGEIVVSSSLTDAVAGAGTVVLTTPAQHMRWLIRNLADIAGHVDGFINAAKGIETGSLKRMSELLIEVGGLAPSQVATLSGPSHAEEVVRDLPTTVVVASHSSRFAQECQKLFSVDHFRVYVSDDLVGVELGGSLKNIIAIATGIIDGLGFGDNTRGALVTRGLAEITRLGVAMGARAETFAGLSGIGDLVTTCTSPHSRNRYVGERVGHGDRLPQILEEMTMVAEGVETTRSAYELAQRHHVEMPITGEVYRVLFEEKEPAEALNDLMGRTLKAEIWT